jgi:hypothetical protein
MAWLNSIDVEKTALLVGVLAQLGSLGFVAWMLLRIDRRIEEGQESVTDQADRSVRALQGIQNSQAALTAAADGVAQASRTWASLPALATHEQMQALLAAVDLLRMSVPTAMEPSVVRPVPELASVQAALAGVGGAAGVVGAAGAAGSPAGTPEGLDLQTQQSLLHERRLRGKAEGEVSEMRKRMDDLTRQLSEANKGKRQQAADATRLAALEATNLRLIVELRESRQQSRETQASLAPMTQEVTSLRAQMQKQASAAALSAPAPEPAEQAAKPAAEDQDVGVYLDRIKDAEGRASALAEELGELKSAFERGRREQLFIEDHYLELQQRLHDAVSGQAFDEIEMAETAEAAEAAEAGQPQEPHEAEAASVPESAQKQPPSHEQHLSAAT